MAGYSGTPLVQKLGIRADHEVALLDAPAEYPEGLGALPEGVTLRQQLPRSGALDVILLFVREHAALVQQFPAAARCLTPAGGLWVAWPKKTSGVASDLTEDRVRAVGLAAGLVDNKVCAVDATWSGLRFVYRVKDRPRAGKPRG